MELNQSPEQQLLNGEWEAEDSGARSREEHGTLWGGGAALPEASRSSSASRLTRGLAVNSQTTRGRSLTFRQPFWLFQPFT